MRKFYWYLTAYLKKHGLIFVFSILLAIAVFSVIIPLIANSLELKKRQFIGLIGEYQLDNLPLEIKNLISVGLTKIEEDGTISPLVAERFVVEDDGQTYRFIIKKNLKWQDGQRLTPEDIDYDLKDTQVLTNKNEIIFKLPAAFSPFPSIVSEPLIKIINYQKFGLINQKLPIGLGKYKINNYKLKNNNLQEIVLDSKTERLIYRFYFSEQDAVTAFKHGQVDILNNLSHSYGFENWHNINLNKKPNLNNYLAVFFDNNHPLFSKNIRQALAYALPKAVDETRCIGPINPNSWAYLEGGKTYDLDLERAIERASDQLPPEPLEFELTTTPLFQQKAEEIKQAWEDFGQKAFEACQNDQDIDDKNLCQNLKIKINVRINNFPDLNNFESLLIGQEIPQDPDQYNLWHSAQSSNFTHYKNTRIDALLEKGRQTLDQNERIAIYQEFQQFFLEDSPVIFLEYLTSYDVSRN